MDPSSLVAIVVLVAVVWFGPRVLLESVGRASDGIAQLFVPPDRALGWPRGVQERDEPWAWRTVAASSAAADGTREESTTSVEPSMIELVDAPFPFEAAAANDALIVRVGAVRKRHRP